MKEELSPKYYYDDKDQIQTLFFRKELSYQSSLVECYLSYRWRPKPSKVDSCRRVKLTFTDNWDLYHFQNPLTLVEIASDVMAQSTYTDPISLESIYFKLRERVTSYQLLHSASQKVVSSKDMVFKTFNTVSSKGIGSLTPESLSKMYKIILKTEKNTILATAHKCIRLTGMLVRRFEKRYLN